MCLFAIARINDTFNEKVVEMVTLKGVNNFFQIIHKAIFNIVHTINAIKKCFDETC